MQAATASIKATLAQQEGHTRLLQSQDEARAAAADTAAPDTRELPEQRSQHAEQVCTLCGCLFRSRFLLLWSSETTVRLAMSKHAEGRAMRMGISHCCHTAAC